MDFTFENTVKQLNAINKAIYGVEPFPVEEDEPKECCDTFRCPHENDEDPNNQNI